MSEWTAYNTALANGEREASPAVEHASFIDGMAFQHDFFSGLPTSYRHCSVIYGEPPWRHGFDVFNKRAGVSEDRSWGDLMRIVGQAIESSDCAWVMPVGKQALRYMPSPDALHDSRLNGNEAYLACWRTEVYGHGTSIDALNEVCMRYGRIGDPFCGYGRTAWYARQHGKQFIVSDHDPYCIGFISENLGGCTVARPHQSP